MPPRIAHKQSNEPYNVTLGVLSYRGTQANGKQTVHCINHLDYWKVKIYSNMIDHNVNSRRPCYSQVYVQPQLLIESHIRCEFAANQAERASERARERDRVAQGRWSESGTLSRLAAAAGLPRTAGQTRPSRLRA